MRTFLFLCALLVSIGLAGSTSFAQDTRVVAADDEVTQASLAVFKAYSEDHDGRHYAEDAVFYDMTQPEPVRGREAIGEMLGQIYGVAFPDAEPETTSLTAVGNRVIMEFIFRGTNTGPFFGNEPTGRMVEVPMLIIYDIRDGHIQEARLYYDGAGYARQLGFME